MKGDEGMSHAAAESTPHVFKRTIDMKRFTTSYLETVNPDHSQDSLFGAT